MSSKNESNSAWIFITVTVMLGAWLFGSCQRAATLRTCGRNDGEYIYSWKGTDKIACIIKKGSYDNLEIVTPNGSGKGSFRGNYVIGNAGGRAVTCAGTNITNLPYGICTD